MKIAIIGLDLDARKVPDYQAGDDSTGELSEVTFRVSAADDETLRHWGL